jgi:hypothetical protein
MRILNIVFNAEIKYQQHAKLKKFIDKDFWSNFDLGKTHKGKTSERGLFIIYELLRKKSFTAYSSSEIYTNLSGHSCSFAPRFLNQKSVHCMAVPAIKAVRNVSKFMPKILPRLYGKPNRNNSLKTVLYDPRISC